MVLCIPQINGTCGILFLSAESLEKFYIPKQIVDHKDREAKVMTHRERLIAALSHQQPDRVPIDIGGTVNSSIVVEGYAKLKRHFSVEANDALCHRMMRVVKVDEKILQDLRQLDLKAQKNKSLDIIEKEAIIDC